jgi:hypothetical protein
MGVMGCLAAFLHVQRSTASQSRPLNLWNLPIIMICPTKTSAEAKHNTLPRSQQYFGLFHGHQQPPSSPRYDRSAARPLGQAVHVEAWDPVALTLVSVAHLAPWTAASQPKRGREQPKQ